MDARPEEADLLQRLTTALAGDDGAHPLGHHDRAVLLRIARDVAHSSERQNAPLAAYLIGRFVEASVEAGSSEADALREASAIVRSLIGEAPV